MAVRRPEPPAFLPDGYRSPYDGMRMSLEEYEALPEEKPYLEYWDGIVLQKAVPKRKHSLVQLELLLRLAGYRREHGGLVGPEGHVWFEGHGWRVPDVAYWATGKPQGDDERFLPPTLAVEIRSSRQSLTQLREKCRQMRANGVDIAWLIDPDARTAEIFDRESDGEPVDAFATLTSPSLPGFALLLQELFAVLDN